jgi:hypothetical protein
MCVVQCGTVAQSYSPCRMCVMPGVDKRHLLRDEREYIRGVWCPECYDVSGVLLMFVKGVGG